MAICTDCPNTAKYKQYIENPNNVYDYDEKTGEVTKMQLLEPITVLAYSSLDKAGLALGLGGGISATGEVLVGGARNTLYLLQNQAWDNGMISHYSRGIKNSTTALRGFQAVGCGLGAWNAMSIEGHIKMVR
jgi:hypothetical protein